MKKSSKEILQELQRVLSVNGKQNNELLYSEQIAYVLLCNQNKIRDLHPQFLSYEEMVKMSFNLSTIGNIYLNINEYETIQRYFKKLDLKESIRSIYEDIYEIFTDHAYKQKCGQFFTPYNVVEMMVEMTVRGNEQLILDSSCGIGTMLVAAAEKCNQLGNANVCLMGIENDYVLARLANARLKMNCGERHTVEYADALLYKADLKADIVLANPPFGINFNGEISEVTFLKQNMKWVKDGGVLAIVIPDGVLGNGKHENIRKWIIEQGRILAVIDLPQSTFQPYTNVKTSMILIQKEKILGDYKIFMAVSEKCECREKEDNNLSEVAFAFKEWRDKNI